MPAIISESKNDQTFIYNLHSRFAVILGELETGNQSIDDDDDDNLPPLEDEGDEEGQEAAAPAAPKAKNAMK